MPVVFLIAIAIVLAVIVVAATGRGGELAYEHADHAPLDLGPVSAADIALLRPPTAMWGYNMQVTDAALDQIARAMRQRDVTIAHLQEQLADLEQNDSYAEPRGAHARQDPGAPVAPDLPGSPESPVPYGISVLDEIFAAGAPTDPSVPANRSVPTDPSIPSGIPKPPGIPEPAGAPGPAGLTEPADPREPASQPPASQPPASQPPAGQAPPRQPRTPLVLKAARPRRVPEPHEATQPSEVIEEPHEITQPSATLPADHQQGPQGSFETYGWWAEQREAAREEHEQEALGQAGQSGDEQHPAGASGAPAVPGTADDPLAAAEEQAW